MIASEPYCGIQNVFDVLMCEKLFTKYEYGAEGRLRFGISLGLLVDCLNTFSSPGHSNTIEIKYKYKFLKATTANIPGNVVNENRGKQSDDRERRNAEALAPQTESAGYQPPSRIAYIEFFVKPEEPSY